MSTRACRACEQLNDICPRHEQIAEARAEAFRRHDATPPLDRWGRDEEWHYPREYAPKGL